MTLRPSSRRRTAPEADVHFPRPIAPLIVDPNLMKTIVTAALLLSTLALCSTGCARAELARARQARETYQACLAEHPREPERCEDLRTAMNREYDRYESVAGERARNWRDQDELPN